MLQSGMGFWRQVKEAVNGDNMRINFVKKPNANP
jgi:hypothetical protein